MKLLKLSLMLLLSMSMALAMPITDLLGQPVPLDQWSGSRSGVVFGNWSLFTINYSITVVDPFTLQYEYELLFDGRDISNWALGVTPGCREDPNCVVNPSPANPDIRWYLSGEPPYGFLPQDVYMAKFDFGSGSSPQTVVFFSNRLPVHQHWVAKDGTGTYAMSGSLALGGSLDPLRYLPGPNGEAIPEPATIILLTTGAVGLWLFRKRLAA